MLIVLLMLGMVAGCGKKNNDGTVDGGMQQDADADDPDGGPVSDADAAPEMAQEQLQIPSLSAPVTVRFDENGILHLECEVARDCFAAQGYIHASDRFYQMELVRSQTLGKLSKVMGFLLMYDSDLLWRHVMTNDQGERLEELFFDALDEESKDVFRAYAQGINAWLDDLRNGRNGARLSEEWDSGLFSPIEDIEDWTPQDSFAPLLQIAYQIGDASVGPEIIKGQLLAQAQDTDVFYDLFAGPPPFDTPIQPPGPNQSTLPPGAPVDLDAEKVARLREHLRESAPLMGGLGQRLEKSSSLLFGPREVSTGSNGWIVGPQHTERGDVLIANDPHLVAANPSAWYPNTLHVKDGSLYLAGLAIPGGPGIVLGHNGHVAWGASNAHLDLSDAWIETLAPSGDAVMRDGAEVPLVRKEFEFEGQRGEIRKRTLEWVPGHGPLLARDDEAGTAISFRWVAHDGQTDGRFLRQLWYATSVEQAEAALDNVRTLNLNWIVGDVDGNIGWFPKAAIPDRTAWASQELPPWLPLPGDGTTEWNGYVDAAELPSVVNPLAGFLVVNNNEFFGKWADGTPYNDGGVLLQEPPHSGTATRQTRATRLLVESSQHTPETMQAMHADTYSLHAEVLLPEILATASEVRDELSPAAQRVVDALEAWDYVCATGLTGTDPEASPASDDPVVLTRSAGCTAFHVLIYFLTVVVFEDELAGPESGIWIGLARNYLMFQNPLVITYVSPERQLSKDAMFDDRNTADIVETRADATSSALESTAEWLNDTFGSDTPEDWLWGRIHVLAQPSLIQLDQYAEGPHATPGGVYTLDLGDPLPSREISFLHHNSSSLRNIMRLGPDGIEAWTQMIGGTAHHRDSPRYQSITPLWLRNERVRLRTPQEVQDAVAETWIIQPAP